MVVQGSFWGAPISSVDVADVHVSSLVAVFVINRKGLIFLPLVNAANLTEILFRFSLTHNLAARSLQ